MLISQRKEEGRKDAYAYSQHLYLVLEHRERKKSSESPKGKQIIIMKCLMYILARIIIIRVIKFII